MAVIPGPLWAMEGHSLPFEKQGSDIALPSQLHRWQLNFNTKTSHSIIDLFLVLRNLVQIQLRATYSHTVVG